MESTKRAVILAGYSDNGYIHDDTFKLLKEFRKFADYIVAFYDNNTLNDESIKTLETLVDYYHIENHGEYDFGSYKKGFQQITKTRHVFENIDRIIFCNDSIIWQQKSLKDFFEKEKNTNFYGLTCNAYGFVPKTYQWQPLPHIQSFLFSVSKNIFYQNWFRIFFANIKKEKNKNDIIANYEVGLSQTIIKNGFTLNSYYPKVDRYFEPCGYYLNPHSNFQGERLFLKRKEFSVQNL